MKRGHTISYKSVNLCVIACFYSFYDLTNDIEFDKIGLEIVNVYII
jgi:hypothetical protein